jgi:hypothetical protein
MALSVDLVALLAWLDEAGYPFDLEYLKNMTEPVDDLSHDERAKNTRFAQSIRKATSQIEEERTRPVTTTRSGLERMLNDLRNITGGDPLDAYFTWRSLHQVPEYVGRWKQLRKVHVQTVPENRVNTYFAQAATCYIHGLFDAVAILSRSVLQFALEEALSHHRGHVHLLKSIKKDYLLNLITLAREKGVITPALAGIAHDIRKRGNGASHEQPCSEAQALRAIKNVRGILLHVYGGAKHENDA